MLVDVFISYSHKDKKLYDKLDTHLSNLRNQGLIHTWHDGDIIPGTEWRTDILTHLNTSRIILLLISADFLASSFYDSVEMKQALARHEANQARVLPILLSSCDWQGAPFAKLQMLPTGARPVTQWTRQDDAFADIVQGIRRAMDNLIARVTPITGSDAPAATTPPRRAGITIEPSEFIQNAADSLRLSQVQQNLPPAKKQLAKKQLDGLLARSTALNSRLEDLKDQLERGRIGIGRYTALTADLERERAAILQQAREELVGLDQELDAIMRDASAGNQESMIIGQLAQVAQQRGLSQHLIASLKRQQGSFLFWLIEVGMELAKLPPN